MNAAHNEVTEANTVRAESGVQAVAVAHDDFLVAFVDLCNRGHERFATERLYTALSFADMLAVAATL